MRLSAGGVCSHSSHTHAPTTSSTLFLLFHPPNVGTAAMFFKGLRQAAHRHKTRM